MITRSCLLTASTTSLHQDGRAGRLLLRYRACNSKLQMRAGVLGQVNLCVDQNSQGAFGIARGTMSVIRNFCTAKRAPPHTSRSLRTAPQFQSGVFAHLKRTIEMIDTDAAADERRAAKVLRDGVPTGSASREIGAELVNLKAHNLDKAHSSRRMRKSNSGVVDTHPPTDRPIEQQTSQSTDRPTDLPTNRPTETLVN